MLVRGSEGTDVGLEGVIDVFVDGVGHGLADELVLGEVNGIEDGL